MTVAELITALQQHDPAAWVVIPGYEGGVDDIDVVQPAHIAPDVGCKWYFGKHEIVENGGVAAVLLAAERNMP